MNEHPFICHDSAQRIGKDTFGTVDDGLLPDCKMSQRIVFVKLPKKSMGTIDISWPRM